MANLLALDQASRVSGYAVFNPQGKLIAYGKFIADEQDIGERLVFIKNKVAELIEKYDISEVIMEDIQQQENVQTFKVLAEVFGVIYEYLTEIKMPNQSVLACEWRKTLHIPGYQRAEQKRNTQAWVAKEYGVKATQDECDAIAIGTHYIMRNFSAF